MVCISLPTSCIDLILPLVPFGILVPSIFVCVAFQVPLVEIHQCSCTQCTDGDGLCINTAVDELQRRRYGFGPAVSKASCHAHCPDGAYCSQFVFFQPRTHFGPRVCFGHGALRRFHHGLWDEKMRIPDAPGHARLRRSAQHVHVSLRDAHYTWKRAEKAIRPSTLGRPPREFLLWRMWDTISTMDGTVAEHLAVVKARARSVKWTIWEPKGSSIRSKNGDMAKPSL